MTNTMTMNEHERTAVMGRLTKDDITEDPTLVCEVKVFLEGYRSAVRMLRLCREDVRECGRLREACHLDATYYGVVGGDEAYWVARMREVREFIDALPHRNVKLFLYFHYIRDLTVERTAEELDIARRSAFRLKKSALGYAALRLPSWRAARSQGTPPSA
jgi:hypothetical protein